MRKTLGKIVFSLSCLAGVLYFMESRYQFLRFREVNFNSIALLPDEFLWQRLGSSSHRYWPIFFIKSSTIEHSIMSVAPVTVSIKMNKPGFFEIDYDPLEPWFLVFWSGGEWFLSRDGRMWSVHHNLNSIISEQLAREGPVLVWGKDLPDPVPSGTNIESAVVHSTIPIDEIETWKRTLVDCDSYSDVSSITVQMREGRRIVEILRRTEPGSVRILLNESTDNWSTLLKATDEILSQSGIKGKNIILDTTYSGKILVRVIS